MKKLFILTALCILYTVCNCYAQKAYHMVTFEIHPMYKNNQCLSTLIFEIPVDLDYYNCVKPGQQVTNYFPCRNLMLLGATSNPEWKIVIISKRSSYNSLQTHQFNE